MNGGRSAVAPHLDGIGAGALLISVCSRCATPEFPPRTQCLRCGDTNPATWWPSSGLGCVWSFAVFHKDYLPDFRLPTPYVVAVIELNEGVRLYGNIIGESTAAVHVGQPVRAVFESSAFGGTHLAFVPEGREAS